MAVYFPIGQQRTGAIRSKFETDLDGAVRNGADGIAFVTNQALPESERRFLRRKASQKHVAAEIYHVDRLVTILDSPPMRGVRKQFLHLADDTIEEGFKHLESLQTGGDSFCYWMLYHFDLSRNIAQDFVIIRQGDYPLYDVRLRVVDMDTGAEVVNRQWGEINAPADYILLPWSLPPIAYYRAFFHARNGNWRQDLLLAKSDQAQCWLAATQVWRTSRDPIFGHTDGGYEEEFGAPTWRK